MPSEGFEKRVAKAVGLLEALRQDVIRDLDEVKGGIAWWHGQVDFKRNAVLTEYLLDSLYGAGQALVSASFEAQRHREGLAAYDKWFHAQWRQSNRQGTPRGESALKMFFDRTGLDRRRDLGIPLSAEHSMAHLVQSLDRIAACFLIVGAVPVSVKKAGWGTARDLARASESASNTPKFEPVATDGRRVQDELFLTLLDDSNFGPTDWLEWLVATRNSHSHRATRMSWHMQIETAQPPGAMLRPFPTQPDFTDVEAMSDPSVEESEGLPSLMLLHRSTDVLEGLNESTVEFTSHLARALQHCWTIRREDPALLCQRGAQWQELRGTRLRFEGYGDRVTLIGNSIHVSPEQGIRLKAAKVLQRERSDWAE